MPPRLAREAVTAAALRGDTAALLATCAQPPPAAFRYDWRRAAAFMAAVRGDRELALAELGLGAGVRSLRLGVDTAVVELLTRGPAPALVAARAALRDGDHSEADVPLLLAECVRRDPELARAALGVAVSGGTPVERTLAAAAVVRAARPERSAAAVPALLAISLVVALVAFARLPGLDDADEATLPTLRDRPPSVVSTRPPARPEVRSPRAAPRPPRSEPSAVLVSQPLRRTARPRPAPPRKAPPPGRAPSPVAPTPAPPVAPATPAPATAPTAAVPPLEATPQVVVRKKAKPDKAERKALRRASETAAAPPAPADPVPATSDQRDPGPPDHAQANGQDKPDKDKPEKNG